MPELAEVDYFRKQWNPGLGARLTGVQWHPKARVFRGQPRSFASALEGEKLLGSEAHGKQMLFRFSGANWLGVHLGMTGSLRTEPASFRPSKHDHLVLRQEKRVLVFSDPRQFGRVLFHSGTAQPDWWRRLPPPILSGAFNAERVEAFLQRRRRLPIKAALLLQECFPGVGNWMADEILWRLRIHPRTPAGELSRQAGAVRRSVRWVSREAMRRIADDFSDPPRGWFFHARWTDAGRCPRDETALLRETVGGRTTAWCPKCQPL